MLISAAQQSDSVIHVCIYSVLKYSFLLWFITGCWIESPGLYSRTLLFLRPVYNSLHLLTPTFPSVFPPNPSPLATTSLFSMSVILLCFVGRFICVQIPHVSDIIRYWSFSSCLPLLSMLISSCIPDAANDIILFFFMAEQYSIIYTYHIFFIQNDNFLLEACWYSSVC